MNFLEKVERYNLNKNINIDCYRLEFLKDWIDNPSNINNVEIYTPPLTLNGCLGIILERLSSSELFIICVVKVRANGWIEKKTCYGYLLAGGVAYCKIKNIRTGKIQKRELRLDMIPKETDTIYKNYKILNDKDFLKLNIDILNSINKEQQKLIE